MQLLRLIAWLGYLTWQIVLGSWNVLSAAWRPGPFGTPAIVEYPMRCMTDFEIAMFTSAITITPGTLVVGVCPGDDAAPPFGLRAFAFRQQPIVHRGWFSDSGMASAARNPLGRHA